MTGRAKNLVFLGPPGSGKGTQAAQVAKELGIAHLSTGNLLREEAQRGSALGKEAEGYMNRGALVPDDVMIAMVRERLAQDDAKLGFLLDGFPRTIAQAEALDLALKEIGKGVDAVIHLRLAEAEIVRRITGRLTCEACGAVFHIDSRPPKAEGVCDACGGRLYQRADDTEEAVRSRLTAYNRQTAPLLEYYGKLSLRRDVEAMGPIETVHQRILEALGDTE